MAIEHEVGIRNGFANSIRTACQGGFCVLRAGGAEVATMPLNNPAFGAASNGEITLLVSPVPEDSAATGNASPVDSVQFQTSGAAEVFTGNEVTGIGGGGDIELSKNPISPGDTVQLTSFTYTASL